MAVFGGVGRDIIFYVSLLWGLYPLLAIYIFTPTVHVGLTVELSFTIIVMVSILRVLKFGLQFFEYVYTMGMPVGLSLGLVIIESVGYLISIVSLGVQLATNI